MKLRKFIVIGIMCLISLTACNDNNKSEKKEVKTEMQTDNKHIDSSEKENNIEEKSPTIRDIQTTYIQDGEWEYFYYQNDRVYKKSGLVRRRLTDGYVEELIINDGEYAHYGETCGIYNIVGDWLYVDLKYAEDENYYICRMKKDGTEIERIVQVYGLENMLVKDGYIYYLAKNKEKKYALYQVKLDGTEEKVIYVSDNIKKIYDVVDGWLYYENYDEQERCVRRIKTDGTGDEVVLQILNFGKVTYYDGWIYYEIKSDTGNYRTDDFTICRKQINGTTEEKIVTKTCSSLFNMMIVNDELFVEYFDYSEYKEPLYESKECIISVKVDGTGEKAIDKSEYPVTWIDMD